MARISSANSQRSAEREVVAPVVGGPRWYRARLLVIGPLAGVALPAILGSFSWIVLTLGRGRQSAVLGLIGAIISAPGLLLAGAPISGSETYPKAILISVVFWLIVGLIAAARATRRPIAGWPDFWREYLLLWIAVAIGAAAGLGIAVAMIGNALL